MFVLPVSDGETCTVRIEKLAYTDHRTFSTNYAFTPSGYVTTDIWIAALKLWKQKMEMLAPGVAPTLLVDSCSAHKGEQAVRFCVEEGLHVFFLLPHCSYFLQPLDATAFACLKQSLAKRLIERTATVIGLKRDIGPILVEEGHKAHLVLRLEVIRKSWADVDIFSLVRRDNFGTCKKTTLGRH